MSEGLPKIPGYSFKDPTQTNFSLGQKFDIVNGYRYPRSIPIGVGKKEVTVNSVGFFQKDDACRYDPTLTYGRAKTDALPQFVPHYVRYDGKCLTFKAFLKQSVTESPHEHYRIRHVNIIYFLDDNTITVMEPRVPNCGFNQGRFLNRGKIPRSESGLFWHWKDLNVGMDVAFYGHVFYTVDCDTFTREYMASQGLEMNPREDLPPDPFMQNRSMTTAPKVRQTPLVDDKFRRYLEYSAQILRFDCVWDDRESFNGEMREHILYYFLEDDTIQIKEVRKRNDGRDPFPKVLKRMKIPKDWKRTPINYPACYLDRSDDEVNEYYSPKDFMVGDTMFILGRRLLLTDCDPFTRNYYKKALNITQKPKINPFPPPPPLIQKHVPPHVPKIGTVEDSLQLVFRLIPKPRQVDVVKQLYNQGKFLRYSAKLVSSHPEDTIRKFMIWYALNDGTMKVNEPVIRNSGISGGKFLRQEMVPKPGTDMNCPEFYTPADLYIGAVIDIHKHMFEITGADLYVYRYMMENSEKFSPEVIKNMRNYMFKEGFLEEDLAAQVELQKEQAEQYEIGPKEKKILSTKEECIEAMKPSYSSNYQFEENKYKDELPIIERKEYIEVPKHQPVGVMSPMKDCRYPAHPEEVYLKPCGNARVKRDPLCCLKPDCLQKTKYQDDEEREQLYMEELTRQHREICDRTEDYYRRPCEKETRKTDLCTKSPYDAKPLRKVVTFADDPLDPCAYNETDLCQRMIKKTHENCTYFNPKK